MLAACSHWLAGERVALLCRSVGGGFACRAPAFFPIAYAELIFIIFFLQLRAACELLSDCCLLRASLASKQVS